jgi:SAM-dependent methyltransferase
MWALRLCRFLCEWGNNAPLSTMTQNLADNYAQTLAFYDDGAQNYFNQTRAIDTSSTRERLTSRLAAGTRILDAGCGSGRDSKHFLAEGFDVTAFDASAPLADLASTFIGRQVQVLRFQDLAWESCFEGIYASASLLHLGDTDLHHALKRLVKSLRPGGVLLALFKHGNGVRLEATTGRLFNDMNAGRARQFLTEAGADYEADYLELDKLGRGNDWLTVIARRPS